MAGRDCPEVVHSQHDRRFIWAGVADADHLVDAAWGHGACTAHADMPPISCAGIPPEVAIRDLLSRHCWNPEAGFFQDFTAHGHPAGVDHIGAFWTLRGRLIGTVLLRFGAL